MKNKKQLIAVVSLAALLIVAIIGGLVKPYLEDKKTVQNRSELTVPDFVFTDRQGNEMHFDDFKGKPIVINYWATWCGYCVQEMADFNAVAAEYSDKVNFLFLDVVDGVQETEEKALAFLEEKGYDHIDCYFDVNGSYSYMFGINSFPTTVYVDKNGNLYDARIGMTNHDEITAVLDKMLEE